MRAAAKTVHTGLFDGATIRAMGVMRQETQRQAQRKIQEFPIPNSQFPSDRNWELGIGNSWIFLCACLCVSCRITPMARIVAPSNKPVWTVLAAALILHTGLI